VVCKVVEKLVRNAILDHMFDNDFISGYQHGFLPGQSCITQLLEVLDKWTEILDNGGTLDVVYLDLAKAFDSVPHSRLLAKLQSYGIEGGLLRWISSFLLDRYQRVMMAGIESNWAPVLSGVSQRLSTWSGSVYLLHKSYPQHYIRLYLYVRGRHKDM